MSDLPTTAPTVGIGSPEFDAADFRPLQPDDFDFFDTGDVSGNAPDESLPVVPPVCPVDLKATRAERLANIRRTLLAYFPNRCTLEVRAFVSSKYGKDETWVGYFNGDKDAKGRDGIQLAAQAIYDLDVKHNANGVYVVANPIDDRLHARSPNEMKKGKPASRDDEVTRIKFFHIDIDPERPADVPSRDNELQAAKDTANEAIDLLRENFYWPDPRMMGMSGNGVWLHFRVDLPNDDEHRGLLHRALQGLKSELEKRRPANRPVVKVDPKVSNPARIVPVYGTVKRKGYSTATQPHRMTEILYESECPDAVVTKENLQALAALAPPPNKPKHSTATQSTAPQGNRREYSDDEKEKRARTYLFPVDGAETGKDGHLHTIVVAAHLIRGFILPRLIARKLMDEYSAKCTPPWSDREIEHKLDEAERHGGEYGYLLHAGNPHSSTQSSQLTAPAAVNHQTNGQATTLPAPALSSTNDRWNAGARVKALDRDNYGVVVSDSGNGEVSVYFESPNGHSATKRISKSQLILLGGNSGNAIASAPTGEPLKPWPVISSKEFSETTYHQTYLVKGILVAGQPCMLGGAHKTLKTSIAIDLAFSLSTGTRFLGQFPIPQPIDVAVLSGESGGHTLKETANRIALQRGWSLSQARIFWSFELPQIANTTHLESLRLMIEENKIGACIIDPAYLCMLAGDTQGRQASNVFQMGSILLGLTEVGQKTGCTMILIHHTRKNPLEPFAVPNLEDLAFAGFAEWARQWLLIGRRNAYEPGTGFHKLWLNVGGSAGHSGTWAVDINEGTPDEDFQGREWQVSVNTATEAKQQAATTREAKKEAAERLKIVTALRRFPEGETQNEIADTASCSKAICKKHLRDMIDDGSVKKVPIRKRKKEYEGYMLVEKQDGSDQTAQTNATPTDPEIPSFSSDQFWPPKQDPKNDWD